jgi:uncharacterized protein (TIGR01777 family)
MKIFMTGGSGFVGSSLTRALIDEGNSVTVLTRDPAGKRSFQGLRFVGGNPVEKGQWQDEVGDHDVIVNLAGASIFGKWNKKVKDEISRSRIHTTRNLVEAFFGKGGRVKTFLSTSAVGYYGSRGDEALTESSGAGNDFLASLCLEWEKTALEAAKSGIRVVICRLGIVLGPSGGALGRMTPIFRKGMGSPLGSGRQWFSWIHQEDLVAAYRFLLSRQDLSGPFNCTAPFPVTNKEFTNALARALGVSVFLPAVPGFVLKMILGESAEVLLGGQRVLPSRLLEAGFSFRFSRVEEALGEIFSRSSG